MAESLTLEEVRAIADLARLELTEEEVQMYRDQLSAILAYFEELQQVDTSEVEAITSVLPLRSVMRDDVAQAPLPPEDVIKNAPDAEANQFRVSAVLEEE